MTQGQVSIVIPIYNEIRFIDKCMSSVLTQNYSSIIEILLVDGGSNDGTLQKLIAYQQKDTRIKLLDNPKRKVQYAMNIGIKEAKCEYIVRFDAHTEYANDYVASALECLQKTHANNVGGPTIANGITPKQKAIAAAFHSSFALGGGKSHDECYEGFADTVSYGCYRKVDVLKIGLYDEQFDRSEDDEFNYRLTICGGKIYVSPKIRSCYYPKDSFLKIGKQYLIYGLWKPAILKKYGKLPRLSHIIPSLFVLWTLVFLLLFNHSQLIRVVGFCVFGLYLSLDLIFSFRNFHTSTFVETLYLLVIHPIIHFSYGLGSVIGLFKFFVLKRPNIQRVKEDDLRDSLV